MQLAPGDDFFIVDEIPAYEASGSGEHLWLHIQKKDCTTPMAAKAIARALGKRDRDIGWAGRKDRHGITSQVLTVHFGDETLLSRIADYLPEGAELTILNASKHKNKLKMGHLIGNRFRLKIDALSQESHAVLTQACAQLAQMGLPNAFGPQRYGHNNLERAIAVGNGATPPRGNAVRYLAEAAQAKIFDTILARRREQNLLTSLRVGDIAMTPRGAAFAVSDDDIADCAVRCANGELFTSGPLPGHKCLAGHADEQAWSANLDIPWEWFQAGPLKSPGGRRPLLVPFLEAPSLKEEWLQFALPPGAYATTVCAELNITLPDRR